MKGLLAPPAMFEDLDLAKLSDNKCTPTAFEAGGGWVLYFVALAYGSLLLARVCDDYLMASIELLTERLKLSDDIAGVSLLALGGSAPELIINLVSSWRKSEVGAGTILGSAIWNVTCALAVISYFVTGDAIVPFVPLLRDTLVYVCCVGLLLFVRQDGEVTLGEALSMVGFYFAFLFGLYVARGYFYMVDCTRRKPGAPDGPPPRGEAPFPRPQEVIDENDPNDSDLEHAEAEEIDTLLPYKRHEHHSHRYEEEHAGEPREEPDEEELEWVHSSVTDKLLWPFNRVLLHYTVPSCTRPGTEENYMRTFAASISWVILISVGVMLSVERIGCSLHLDEAFAGSTLLAVGASLPDTIAVVVAARRGHGSMAVAGLIGSNVFDILIGLGLPWVVYNLAYGALKLTSPNIAIGVTMLFAAIAACFLSIVAHGCRLSYTVGILPVMVYVSYVTWQVVDD